MIEFEQDVVIVGKALQHATDSKLAPMNMAVLDARGCVVSHQMLIPVPSTVEQERLAKLVLDSPKRRDTRILPPDMFGDLLKLSEK